jgi:hypothetical protein
MCLSRNLDRTMIFEMLFYYVLALVLLVTVRRAVPVSIAVIGLTVLLGKVIGVHSPTLVVESSPILLEFILGAVAALAFVRFGQRKWLGIAMLILGVAASLYMRAYPEQGGAAGIDMVLSSAGAIRHVLTWGVSAALIVAGVIFWSPVVQSLPGRIAVVLGECFVFSLSGISSGDRVRLPVPAKDRWASDPRQGSAVSSPTGRRRLSRRLAQLSV